MNTSTLKLGLIATVPNFFVHLLNNIQEYQRQNIEVTLITSHEAYGEYLKKTYGFKVIEIEIARDISLFKDLRSLWQLWRHLKNEKYDIVHSLTPKAGLITSIAGLLTKTPVRIHTFTGQRWATLQGPLRWFLKKLDTLVIRLDTRAYTDSNSQIQYLLNEGVAKTGELYCLNKGSLGGIDPHKFQRPELKTARALLSEQLSIPEEAKRILFVGRITPDKGIHELVQAFTSTCEETGAYLILLGDMERLFSEEDQALEQTIKTHPKIKYLGFQKKPDVYMAACDFLCIPSYREGFGTVVIEAAAAGICALGTDIPGLRDAIVDNSTGLLVPVKDVESLAKGLVLLCSNDNLRISLSAKAQERAYSEFDFKIISTLQIADYKSLVFEKSPLVT
ncbi:glycosyltransferase family 4 protein [Bdellovibrio sp. HCB337]|uniref:glycosyltransferase family 4 protein n=1 Tax=Bdellovibrio sp. HCB337 TaxID=3394358 RepID=UPI0039A54172